MKKIMLIYPPSKLHQRGEDRCQSSIEDSTATSIRACNDLGYVSSILKKKEFEIFLKDYQSEKLSEKEFFTDFKIFNPDVVFLSVTNTSIFNDLQFTKRIKKCDKDIIIILKGAIFFNPELEMLDLLDLSSVDYLIGGEVEFCIDSLLLNHFNDSKGIEKIQGISYKLNGKWTSNFLKEWKQDLDSLPFPDRRSMNNLLYTRPDTDEPQATIATSRGCPSNCIYCLTPSISGKNLRTRSPENILEEIKECYYKYSIKNFFFKSDTFTINKTWTLKVCRLIEEADLGEKIQWVANSRTKPIDLETLQAMKKAGCWLIAFGYESGSQESLDKMHKGTTIEDNYKATVLAKKTGLKIFGFFMIGFPWETEKNLQETKKMIFKINADFVELHLATPFYGTKLYSLAKEKELIKSNILGENYFEAPSIPTEFLTTDELLAFKKRTLLLYHLRINYIFKKVIPCIFNPKVLLNYAKFGLRLIKNNF